VVAHPVCNPFHRQLPIRGWQSAALTHLTDPLKYGPDIEKEEWKRRKTRKGEERGEEVKK
jgi:hypothetical protein